jgi:hypothetical protein
MGRDLKRVPLDFKWPLRKTWGGFIRPDELDAITCDACGGTGWNPAMRQLSDDWYDHAGFGSRWRYDYKTGLDGKPATNPPWKVFGKSRAWQHQLTQDEVDHLIEEGRLNGYVNTWDDVARKWVRDPSKPWPTAEQINHDMHFGMGHDGINHAIMVRFRGKRLGIYGLCPNCDGETCTYRDEAHRAAADAWTETPIPTGTGYQMWETVSEGSPISPVFDTPTKLAAWLVRHEGGSFASWMSTIENGYAPSMVMMGGKLQTGVEASLDRSKPAFNVYEAAPTHEDGIPTHDPDEIEGYEFGFGWGQHPKLIRRRMPVAPTSKFEAIFPDNIKNDAQGDFLAWISERKIKVTGETWANEDLFLTGSLSPAQAMEFKMRWV